MSHVVVMEHGVQRTLHVCAVLDMRTARPNVLVSQEMTLQVAILCQFNGLSNKKMDGRLTQAVRGNEKGIKLRISDWKASALTTEP